MVELNEKQLEMCTTSQWDFSDLSALFLNCTMKRSPEMSHTRGLIDISKAIMEKNGVSVEVLRPIDYDIATGVYPDMTEQGWDHDDWPEIYEKAKASEILVLPPSPEQIPVPDISAPRARAVFASSESAPKLMSDTKRGISSSRGFFAPGPMISSVPTDASSRRGLRASCAVRN